MKRRVAIPVQQALDMLATRLVAEGRIPPDVHVEAVVPINGPATIDFEWEEQ